MTAVGIVPHTHWDREWYAPFQQYRVQLVHLVDDLLDLLEADPSFTAVPARRPDRGASTTTSRCGPTPAPRLAALVAAGRLQVGPWMVLMDEFMVSGETIVRNLQLGLARADGPRRRRRMRVGYLPDMFGHVAQMPQILRLAGLEHAVVWRGVPATIDRTAFWWGAPDGSTVRAEYLYGSYSNGRDLPADPTQLVARARGYEARARRRRAARRRHAADERLRPPACRNRGSGAVVADANAMQDEYRFAVTSLAEYVARAAGRRPARRGAASCGRARAPTC